MTTTLPQPGDLLGGRYRLQSQLGAGGMGVVMLALDSATGHQVALKLMRPSFLDDQVTRARFEREMAVLRQLRHPNIAQLLDYGQQGPFPFTVMEFVGGQALGDFLNAHGRLSPAKALEIVAQVASALAEVHERRIVHRDLKPANILVDIGPPTVAKVLDFGVAKSLAKGEPQLTKTGLVIGTPGYISPELAVGAMPPSPASDVYACGVLLLEMLLGRPLFVGPNAIALMIQSLEKGVRIPSPLVGTAIGQLIEKATVHNPALRHRDGAELATAVRGAMGASQSTSMLSDADIAAFFQEYYPSADAEMMLAAPTATDQHELQGMAPALVTARHELAGSEAVRNEVRDTGATDRVVMTTKPEVAMSEFEFDPGKDSNEPQLELQRTAPRVASGPLDTRQSSGQRHRRKQASIGAPMVIVALVVFGLLGGAIYMVYEQTEQNRKAQIVADKQAKAQALGDAPKELELDVDEAKLYIFTADGMQSVPSIQGVPPESRALVVVQTEYILPDDEFYIVDLYERSGDKLVAQRVSRQEVETRAAATFEAASAADSVEMIAQFVAEDSLAKREKRKRKKPRVRVISRRRPQIGNLQIPNFLNSK